MEDGLVHTAMSARQIAEAVLILVVVEDGLVQVRVNVESNARTVLILVVVEDGLVHISMKQFMHFINES